MNKKISVANLVMLAGGVVTLLFSFFGFYKSGGTSRSAWSSDGGAFAATVPAILAIVMIVWCGLELAGQKLPAQVLTFNSTQLKATWGIGAGGLMIAWLATDFGGLDHAIGFWFMLIGSLAMAAGSVMALLGKGTEMVDLGHMGSKSGGTPPPPPPGGMTPPPPPPS
jgi:hypothetical protein